MRNVKIKSDVQAKIWPNIELFPRPQDIIVSSKPLELCRVHFCQSVTQDKATIGGGENGAIINNDTLDVIMIVTTNLTDSS